MKKALQKFSIVSVGLLTPALAFAQRGSLDTTGLEGAMYSIYQLLGSAVPVLIALGLVGFLWGIVQYLFGKKEDGKKFMLWGIIALFVMTSVWGLVGILRSTAFGTGTDNARNVQLPNYNN